MAPVSTFYWILCFISIGFSFLFLFFDKFLAKFEKSICFLIKSMVWLICYERLFIYCRIFGLQIIILCWICNLLPHESKAHHYRALCLIFIQLPLQPIGRRYYGHDEWRWDIQSYRLAAEHVFTSGPKAMRNASERKRKRK